MLEINSIKPLTQSIKIWPSKVKTRWDIFQIFVPFPKSLNLKYTSIWFDFTFCVPRNVQVKHISIHGAGWGGLNGRGQGQVGSQEFFRKNYHLLWCLNICMISSSIELCVFVWKMLDLHIFSLFLLFIRTKKCTFFQYW